MEVVFAGAGLIEGEQAGLMLAVGKSGAKATPATGWSTSRLAFMAARLPATDPGTSMEPTAAVPAARQQATPPVWAKK